MIVKVEIDYLVFIVDHWITVHMAGHAKTADLSQGPKDIKWIPFGFL